MTRPAHGGYPGEVIVHRDHTLAECDRELRASPNWLARFHGDPEDWTCSCGRRFTYAHDEAEGDFWAPVEGSS